MTAVVEVRCKRKIVNVKQEVEASYSLEDLLEITEPTETFLLQLEELEDTAMCAT